MVERDTNKLRANSQYGMGKLISDGEFRSRQFNVRSGWSRWLSRWSGSEGGLRARQGKIRVLVPIVLSLSLCQGSIPSSFVHSRC